MGAHPVTAVSPGEVVEGEGQLGVGGGEGLENLPGGEEELALYLVDVVRG